MKLLGYVLAGCMMLEAAKAAIVGLVLALLLVIAIAFARNPVGTLTVAGGLTVLSIVNAYPMTSLMAIVAVAISAAVCRRR